MSAYLCIPQRGIRVSKLLLRTLSEKNHHPVTGENVMCPSTLSQHDYEPTSVAHIPGGVSVEYHDNDIHEFEYDFLRSMSNFVDPGNFRAARQLCTLPVKPSAKYVKYNDLHLARRHVDTTGYCIVSGAPNDSDRVIHDVQRECRMDPVESHFGDREYLQVNNTRNKHNNQLGYTNSAIPLHTDLPFYEKPPTFQLLHCITPADSGGTNIIVNALDAYRAFFSLGECGSIGIFDLKCTDMLFRRVQAEYQKQFAAPIISGMGSIHAGNIACEDTIVRVSPFSCVYPHENGNFQRYMTFYCNYLRACYQMARYIKLREGELLIYNNHWCLHGRTGFTGDRLMIGSYFDSTY